MPAKKKVKPGLIEPDKDALALNVHYTEEVTDEDGETTKTKKVKQVRLGNLDPSADIAAMASQVVADCKYIPSKNLGLVEQALLSLQSRVLTAHGRSGPSSNNVGGAGGGGGGRSALGMGGVSSGEVLADPREGRDRGGGGGGAAERLPPASMSSIDEYLELMYEENIETKVRGTGMVLQLCCSVGNLEALVQNASLMSLLSRLLESEHKSSLEMTYNIVRCFLAFSSFQEMHGLLAQHKCGAVTLKVLAHEESRVSLRERDLQELDKDEKRLLTGADVQQQQLFHSQGGESEAAAHREAALRAFRKKRAKAEAKANTLKRWSEKVMGACFMLLSHLAEDEAVEVKMLKRSLLEMVAGHLRTASSVPLLEVLVRFLTKLSRIEENVQRMHELKVVPALAKLVPATASRSVSNTGGEGGSGGAGGSRHPQDEGKDGEGIAVAADGLTSAALKLLINLAFDADQRIAMVQAGLVPRLVSLLASQPKHRAASLKLLYLISYEDRHKALFAHTDAVPVVMQMIINFPGDLLGKELAALAVNMSWHPRVAEAMCHFPKRNAGLYELVQRCEAKKDPLLMKVIRNLSHWTLGVQQAMAPEALVGGEYPQRGLWGQHVSTLVGLLEDAANSSSSQGSAGIRGHRQDYDFGGSLGGGGFGGVSSTGSGGGGGEDFLVEILGTLANLTTFDLPRTAKDPKPAWGNVLKRTGLLQVLNKYLVPEMAQPDVVLEVVMLCGQMLTDGSAAPQLAASGLANALFRLWQDQADTDAELQIQLLYTFFRFLSYQDTREELLYGTRATAEILNCVDSPHPSVRAAANACLDVIVECDRVTPNEARTVEDAKSNDDESKSNSGGNESSQQQQSGGLGRLGLEVCRRRFRAHNKEWLASAAKDDYSHGRGAYGGASTLAYGGGGMRSAYLPDSPEAHMSSKVGLGALAYDSPDSSEGGDRGRYGGLEDSKLGESTEDSRDDSDIGGGYGYRGESKGGEEKGSW